MANRYGNLIGTNKIRDEYPKINQAFDKVQQEVDALEADIEALMDIKSKLNNIDFAVTNLVNGKGDNLDGWTIFAPDTFGLATDDKAGYFYINALESPAGMYALNTLAGHKYYYKLKYFGDNTAGFTGIRFVILNGVTVTAQSDLMCSNVTALTEMSGILMPSGNGDRVFFKRNATSGMFWVKEIMLIDLTEAFGIGNEPTITEANELFGYLLGNWFYGYKSLFKAKTLLEKYIDLKK